MQQHLNHGVTSLPAHSSYRWSALEPGCRADHRAWLPQSNKPAGHSLCYPWRRGHSFTFLATKSCHSNVHVCRYKYGNEAGNICRCEVIVCVYKYRIVAADMCHFRMHFWSRKQNRRCQYLLLQSADASERIVAANICHCVKCIHVCRCIHRTVNERVCF